MSNFQHFVVQKSEEGTVSQQVRSFSPSPLAADEVRLEVLYSSVNYKDAMAATGHPGIVKKFPHVPGIDAVGTVLESHHPQFSVGDVVIATGHELGVERWGGWSSLVDVPGGWLVPLPTGLTPKESMALGTAGFTAAQCVQALIRHGVTPDTGDVIVTGATGGVGSLSVALLSHLNYRVVAMTGKSDQHERLRQLGATAVVGRDALHEEKVRPLHSTQFAAGIDTVGGAPLASMVKRISHRGCVAACGMAAGADLPLTVYPFILRGVTLAGIDSAWCPDDARALIWQKLAQEWKLDNLTTLIELTTLDQVMEGVHALLNDQPHRHIVVDCQSKHPL